MARISATRKKLEGLGVRWPNPDDHRLLPQDEDDLYALLANIREARGTVGVSNVALEKFQARCEAAAERCRAERGVGIVPVHAVWEVPPEIGGRFALDPAGDLNLLMNKVPLTSETVSTILKRLIEEIVDDVGGVQPTLLGIFDAWYRADVEPRFIVRWDVPRVPTLVDLDTFHRIADVANDFEVTGRKEHGHGWERVCQIPGLDSRCIEKRHGIYFGSERSVNGQSVGILVSRKFDSAAGCKLLQQTYPLDWIGREVLHERAREFQVEVREGCDPNRVDIDGMHQSDFLGMIIQIAYYLKHSAVIDSRALAIRIYRALNRVGTEQDEHRRLYGMQGVLETIERVVFLPLQQSRLAQAYTFCPESVLLAGVTGTGKTLLAKYLMAKNYNCVFACISADELLRGLISNDHGSTFLIQIDRISSDTGLPVVLQIDDIDAVRVKDDTMFISRLLNLMKGVRERGFFILSSTNHPEEIDPRLLEPGRLSKIVYVPTPEIDDRRGVLRKHLEDKPFESDSVRDRVIERMALATEGWTSRFLWELTQEAARVCALRSVGNDITRPENDDAPPPLAEDDFTTALALTRSGMDIDRLKRWDEQIRRFVWRHGGEIGFRSARQE